MKVEYNKYQINFKCGHYDEYIKFLSALNDLVTCFCNKYNGICERCVLSKIFDDNDIDLCDIITNSYLHNVNSR